MYYRVHTENKCDLFVNLYWLFILVLLILSTWKITALILYHFVCSRDVNDDISVICLSFSVNELTFVWLNVIAEIISRTNNCNGAI